MAEIICKKDNWDEVFQLKLTKKEIQMIYDALWDVPYSLLNENSEYESKDCIYNVSDFDNLADDFYSFIKEVNGLYNREF